MGKISNVMYMIDLLNTGNVYTVKELSEKIGVTERMLERKYNLGLHDHKNKSEVGEYRRSIVK